MSAFEQRIAVVTGAGSGIGQALALELARRGAKLAISDIDTDGLARTEESIRKFGAPVKADRLDVTERESVGVYADSIASHYGAVNQIYNIAGVAFMGDVEVTEFKDLERVMDIDFWGVVNGTKAFLPHLIASGDGHVVNMSSMFGLFAVQGQGAYNSAKFAVRGFTEALRQEMAVAGHPVQVTCVHPGYIKTPLVRKATAAAGLNIDALEAVFQKVAITSPGRAAKVILNAVAKNKARTLPGVDAKLFDAVVRLTGSGYMRLLVPLNRRLLPPSR